MEKKKWVNFSYMIYSYSAGQNMQIEYWISIITAEYANMGFIDKIFDGGKWNRIRNPIVLFQKHLMVLHLKIAVFVYNFI